LPSDIAEYDAYYGITGAKPQAVSVDGFNTSTAPGNGKAEVALDMDMMSALAPGAKQILVYEDNNSQTAPGQDFYAIYVAIADANAADIVSTSWYVIDAPNVQSEVTAENQVFEQMVAQGMVMFAASGDDGAFPNGPYAAASVEDPASQPYVTAVGGTSLSDTSSETYGSEAAWCDGPTGTASNPLCYSTGGGYLQSTPWPRPYYQNNLFNISTSGGNQSYVYRNVPDVSLCAAAPGNEGPYSVYVNGSWQRNGGTSAAAPLWAAFAALIDQKVDSRIPYLNEALYRLGEDPNTYARDFNDITTYSNPQDSNFIYPVTTFNGQKYNDAIGWGSFNGANLLSDYSDAQYNPYMPAGITVGPDGTTYFLWNGYGHNGCVAIMSINAAGAVVGNPTFGPVAGWDATSMAVGSDNMLRVLSDYNGSSTMEYWSVSGDIMTYHFGATLTGFKPMTISATENGNSELVWWNTTTNGVQCWSLTGNSYTPFLNYSTAPISNPALVTGAADSNGNTYILWAQPESTSGGQFAIYTFNSSGTLIAAPAPWTMSPGWSVQSFAVGLDNVARVLLTNANDQLMYWTYSGGSVWESEVFPAPGEGFLASGIAGATNGTTYILGQSASYDAAAYWYGTGNSLVASPASNAYVGY
jgi:subtilase family serine protease